MQGDLTRGNVARVMFAFALPMIAGNLLQQFYNIADTLIVGQYLGSDALAAVGSAFTLMTFLTSIILGLCMGSGAYFSMLFGAGRTEELKISLFDAFVLIGVFTLALNIGVLLFIDRILALLQTPADIYEDMRAYLKVIFFGIGFTFLYNYFASFLRALGNSFVPLVFLAVSAILNIGLDFLFVLGLDMGVAGAAWATIMAQAVSGMGIASYCMRKCPQCRLQKKQLRFQKSVLQKIMEYSLLTCVQQSVMNFGILMIQGLVNSFGVQVMAAFAAAVKIEAFAYMPVQDFGNAFSTFIAQNYGAGQRQRIREGILSAIRMTFLFCLVISALVVLFAPWLMRIFVKACETEILKIGVGYLRTVGFCYFGIGCLFLLYGLYRGLGCPGISVVLTVISLGTRVVLAYTLAPIPAIGLKGIWWAIPIGWGLADIVGIGYYYRQQR